MRIRLLYYVTRSFNNNSKTFISDRYRSEKKKDIIIHILLYKKYKIYVYTEAHEGGEAKQGICPNWKKYY